jgi:hypothetical protein
MKWACNHCTKEYTKKSSLDRHQLICEFLHKSTREKQVELEETSGLPSYTELVYIVQELARKNSQIEKKLAELENQTTQYKKCKINVEEWLNQHKKPPYTYADIVSHLNIQPDHIKMLFETKLIPIICNIMETDLVKSACPLYCVKNTLYCYVDAAAATGVGVGVGVGAGETTKWVELEKKILVQMLNKLYHVFLNRLCQWRTENLERLNASDKLSISYNQAMIRLMDVDFNQDVNLNKIKTHLCNHLRCEIKNVTEYEFE